eukprot:gene8077-7301_t
MLPQGSSGGQRLRLIDILKGKTAPSEDADEDAYQSCSDKVEKVLFSPPVQLFLLDAAQP